MNIAFIFACSLLGLAQETYKKIEIIAPEISSPPALILPGLNITNDFKTSTEESLLEMPNVNFAGGTNRPRYLQIRGQGETSVYENTPSHSVGFFIDDIDLTGVSATWPTLNTERLDLWKGPQSTLWGGSVSAGRLATTLTSPGKPSQARLSYLSQQAYQLGAELDVASRSRLFLNFNRDPGFFKNNFKNTDSADRNEYYVSLKNDLLSSGDWDVSTTHLALKTDNSYDVWSLNRPGVDDDFTTLSDQPGQDNVFLQGHAVHVERHLNSRDSLVSISSLAHSESAYSYDADWGNNPYWQSIPGWNQNYDYFDEFLRQRTAWHQKLYFKSGASTLGAHLYGLDEDSEVSHFKDKAFKEGLSSRFASFNAAVFVDWRIPLSTPSSLLVGGRYEAQRLRYSDTTLAGVERAYRFPAAHLGWQFDWSEQTSSSFVVTQGFKSPGVNIDSTLSERDRFFNPEQVTNYEARLSTRLSQTQLSTQIFMMDQRDKQVKVSRQDDPMDPGSFTYFTANAARTRTYGLEAQAQHISGSWMTEAQLGLLKAEFRDYFFENQNLRGQDLAHAPTWSYAAGLSKKWTPALSSTLSVTGKNSFAFSNNHDQRSTPVHLTNLGLTYKKERWTFSAWVNNIFDKRYAVRGFYFANEPPNWENKLYTQSGPPRHGGLSLSYLF